jgi:hypothetical protein
MKVTFQAKDIQEMLAIARQRYEYLATKIGISPEIAEVVGRGKAHLYSFRNALQFAIAHPMNAMGLPPRAIRWILNALDPVGKTDVFPIYEYDKRLEAHLSVVGYGQDRRWAIGKRLDGSAWIEESIWEKKGKEIQAELIAKTMLNPVDFASFETYASFNLGLIKEKVQGYSKG